MNTSTQARPSPGGRYLMNGGASADPAVRSGKRERT